MPSLSLRIDRLQATFEHDGLVDRDRDRDRQGTSNVLTHRTTPGTPEVHG